MFSVVIPLYNKESTIKKTIQSVLSQTYINFELIIVDDGSTDNSLQVVSAFEDARITIIKQCNEGVSTARNNGILSCKREYIAFLDADDWWENDYLEKMKQLIIAYPDAGMYGSRYNEYKRGKVYPALIGVPDSFKMGYINYFNVYSNTLWMPLFPSSAIIPKKIFSEGYFFCSKLMLGEDLDLWVSIALHHPIAYLNTPLVYYNQDVEIKARGVNPDRFHKPDNHYVYNLDKFKNDELQNADLKRLLDILRAQALFKYHIFNVNKRENDAILGEINWDNIPENLKKKYSLPKFLSRLLWIQRRSLFLIKNNLINMLTNKKILSGGKL